MGPTGCFVTEVVVHEFRGTGLVARCGGHRVWDLVEDTWASGQRYRLRLDAGRAAAELECWFDRSGPRDPKTVAWPDPPKRVECRVIAQRWRTGTLDLWLREPDGWYGPVQFDGDESWSWWQADRLRPEGSDDGFRLGSDPCGVW